MHRLPQNNILLAFLSALFFFSAVAVAPAQTVSAENTSIDRIQLVSEQIKLLKNRLLQAQTELKTLNVLHEDQISQMAIEKVSKNLLDKAALDIMVTKSNLDSINIELTDSQQTNNWLEKNIQEIENQLNVVNIFGIKSKPADSKLHEYRLDLSYQQKLIALEKSRALLLQELQKNGRSNSFATQRTL